MLLDVFEMVRSDNVAVTLMHIVYHTVLIKLCKTH